MFERYTEKARRVIMFARYEASQAGSRYIEPHHTLLAVFREQPEFANLLSPAQDAAQSIRKRCEAEYPRGEPGSTSVDIPLGAESKKALAYAAEECERMSQPTITPGHLLLGILRVENSLPARIFQERGVALDVLRRQVKDLLPQGTPPRGVSLPLPGAEETHALLDSLPDDRRQAAARVVQLLAEEFVAVAVSSRWGCYSAAFGEKPAAASERYPERISRAIYFARLAAADMGARAVEPEHLLLGIFREDEPLAVRLLGSPKALDTLRAEVRERAPAAGEAALTLNLPMRAQTRHALASAAEEAAAPGQPVAMTTEHVILGLLREPDCYAAELLLRHGVTPDSVRKKME